MIKVVDQWRNATSDFDMLMTMKIDEIGVAMETAWFSPTANLEVRIRNIEDFFWLIQAQRIKVLPFRLKCVLSSGVHRSYH